MKIVINVPCSCLSERPRSIARGRAERERERGEGGVLCARSILSSSFRVQLKNGK